MPRNKYGAHNVVTLIRSSLKFDGIKGFPSEAQVCFRHVQFRPHFHKLRASCGNGKGNKSVKHFAASRYISEREGKKSFYNLVKKKRRNKISLPLKI